MTSRAYTRAYTTPFDTLSLLGACRPIQLTVAGLEPQINWGRHAHFNCYGT